MADTASPPPLIISREQLIHSLYEAAELEHNLMCTYLYAAFSLKAGEEEGLSAQEAEAVGRWRKAIIGVAVEEMGHLTAVWNITAALGGQPRFGRGNFPLDPGYLPAGITVKLAPFSEAVIQHFIHLERPAGSEEPEGAGFEPARLFSREPTAPRLTPMALDYETVGDFYHQLGEALRAFTAQVGEAAAFCGDPALQMGASDIALGGARQVRCLKTALEALAAIVEQGEGASALNDDSHFCRFMAIREEFVRLKAANLAFEPAWPAAVNPVLRRPPQPEGRVWIEDPEAAATVDLANACYQLMLRLLGYAYAIPSPSQEKALAVDLSIALMQATARLGERAARLPAGASNASCNAGMSFTALRDAAAFTPGEGARRFFIERLAQFADAAQRLASSGDRLSAEAARLLRTLAERAAERLPEAGKAHSPSVRSASTAPQSPAPASASSTTAEGVEIVEGRALTLHFEGKRCIHARFCVTGAPTVFLANVEGPWIHPDTMDAERLVAIAEACPSGAIRYARKDGRPDEAPPPVNLAAIREGGPYAVRGELILDGKPAGFRATLCRCGASKNKPFCDGSHHDVGFNASGEPATTDQTEMLKERGGPLMIDPQPDGPLRVRGNLELTAGTGRMVARIQAANLCRCGASANKPFCDGSHVRVGFRAK
jgi:CDGSH-type Zn-finger protein/uncharacterized Fe-S cluster protein YjdI